MRATSQGPFVPGQKLEDARQQELHGTRLRSEPRDAADVEVCRLGSEQKVGVEKDRCGEPSRAVHACRYPGGRFRAHEGFHPQRHLHVSFRGEPHIIEWDGLNGFLWLVTQDGAS